MAFIFEYEHHNGKVIQLWFLRNTRKISFPFRKFGVNIFRGRTIPVVQQQNGELIFRAFLTNY